MPRPRWTDLREKNGKTLIASIYYNAAEHAELRVSRVGSTWRFQFREHRATGNGQPWRMPHEVRGFPNRRQAERAAIEWSGRTDWGRKREEVAW